MDQVTASMCQLGVGKTYYARILVEVDAAKELKSTVKIEYVDKDKNVKGSKEVLVEYEWKPKRCSHCKVFGHGNEKCGNRPRTVDELKEIEIAKEKELMQYKKNGQNRSYGPQVQRQEYRKREGGYDKGKGKATDEVNTHKDSSSGNKGDGTTYLCRIEKLD
ncbi:hypothetical protein CTI12_AA380540 [Artemisia annua]|uniref:ATPase, F1/V1/A1 complex, alpha/beta subunit, Zinc knuckle CX2CX4HX4C n=1 Tax=Artemisia annua TaxID=35608 RepID=A0A2U1M9M3_ARTAN|nr:hypothetical protein CTI12_AA380540 [Artemisia annua]